MVAKLIPGKKEKKKKRAEKNEAVKAERCFFSVRGENEGRLIVLDDGEMRA